MLVCVYRFQKQWTSNGDTDWIITFLTQNKLSDMRIKMKEEYARIMKEN